MKPNRVFARPWTALIYDTLDSIRVILLCLVFVTIYPFLKKTDHNRMVIVCWDEKSLNKILPYKFRLRDSCEEDRIDHSILANWIGSNLKSKWSANDSCEGFIVIQFETAEDAFIFRLFWEKVTDFDAPFDRG